MTTIIVQGTDIQLRDFVEEDKDQLFEIIDRNRGHLRNWLFWVDLTTTPEDSLNFIKTAVESNDERASLVLGMWRGSELVGAVSLVNINFELKLAELGYWVAEHEQGKGYVTSACKSLITYAFENFEIDNVRIKCVAANESSHAVIKRLGLACSRSTDETQWIHGHQSTEAVEMFCGETSRLTWQLLQQPRISPTMFSSTQQQLPDMGNIDQAVTTIGSPGLGSSSAIGNI